MHNGRNGNSTYFRWDEISQHDGQKKPDKWLVVNQQVYNITEFSHKHPGGSKIISAHAGQDATEAWTAMHPDKQLMAKYMKPLHIGQVHPDDANYKTQPIIEDFHKIRAMAFKNGWFDTNPLFYIFYLFQVQMFEAAALLMLWYFGVNSATFLLASLLLSTAQAQAGWAQHDYGHFSVFNTNKLNKIGHEFVIAHLKGAASRWWNFRHQLHHSKPNIIKYDPDVDVPYLFLLGDKMPVEWGQKKRGFMPYQWQHDYFFLFGPPVLLPFYFHYENVYFMLKRKDYRGLIWTMSFFFKFFYLFNHVLHSWSSVFGLYMLARFFESHWFTMVTQMSHIPMEVDRDQKRDWVSLQLKATCNATSGWFNDWFTGHLNYQIEHHLFPDMPRHNYHFVKPHIEALCSKYHLVYQEKPLLTAFADIYRSLRKSGELWLEAYTNPG